MFMKMFIICKNLISFCFTRMLIFNGAQQQYENTNASKKELKLTKTFSIPSFGKIKIKLSNISDPLVKNLSTKLRIVGFREACTTLKCSLNFCFGLVGSSIKPKNFCSLTYTVANHLAEVLKW